MRYVLDRALHVGADGLLRPRLLWCTSLWVCLDAGGSREPYGSTHSWAIPPSVWLRLVHGWSEALSAQVVPHRLRDLAKVRCVEGH
eukprot:1716225-Amphidinium_carterae.2